jgi:uncharacterized membrane protein
MKGFLKTTIIGGIVFLVPVGILLAALGHALRFVVKAIQPVSSGLHLDQIGKVAGIGIVTILAILLLVLVAFVAGLIARTRIGGRISGWFETSFFDNFPKYQTFKSMAQGLEQIEGTDHGLKPALVSAEGGWQIGYLLEPLENDWVAVFIPHAPTPMAGTIKYFPSDRVRSLNIPMSQLTEIVKNIGVGSRAALRGANLGHADEPLRSTGGRQK